MKLTLLEKVIQNTHLPWYRKNLNLLPIQEKRKIAKLLIHNQNIQLNRKIENYPYLKIKEQSFVKRVNLNPEYATSYFNMFKYLAPVWKRRQLPDPELGVIINAPRKSTTYQYKMRLNKNPLKLSKTLDLLIFQAGFARSLKEGQHFIKQGYIYVNDQKITKINYVNQSGDVIVNYHPASLLTYFNQKYLALIPFKEKWGIPYRSYNSPGSLRKRHQHKRWYKKKARITMRGVINKIRWWNMAIKRAKARPNRWNKALLSKYPSLKEMQVRTRRVVVPKGQLRAGLGLGVLRRFPTVLRPRILEKEAATTRVNFFRFPFAIQPSYLLKTNFNKVIYL